MDLNAKNYEILEKLQIERTKFDQLYQFDECLQILFKENSSGKDPTIPNKHQLNSKKLFNLFLDARHFLYSEECYDGALEYYQKFLLTRTNVTRNLIDILNSSLQQLNELCKTNVEITTDLKVVSNTLSVRCKLKNEQACMLKLTRVWPTFCMS